MATSTVGSMNTTTAGWVAPSVVSTSTRSEPATTWALVTTPSFPTGHDEPASAPPQPKAITLEVTAVAVRMPGVSTSGGIDAGAGAPGGGPGRGVGDWLLGR